MDPGWEWGTPSWIFGRRSELRKEGNMPNINNVN
jgi:hypothetical protein